MHFLNTVRSLALPLQTFGLKKLLETFNSVFLGILKVIIGGVHDLHDHLTITNEAGLESWFSAIQLQDFLLLIYMHFEK